MPSAGWLAALLGLLGSVALTSTGFILQVGTLHKLPIALCAVLSILHVFAYSGTFIRMLGSTYFVLHFTDYKRLMRILRIYYSLGTAEYPEVRVNSGLQNMLPKEQPHEQLQEREICFSCS